MSKSDDAARKIAQARTALVLDSAFFGTLALRLHVQEDEQVKTFCTDGVNLKYNPQYVVSLSNDEVQGAICHEVLHCSNGHPWREGARDHKRCNAAADYAINPIIIDAGMKLPAGALFDRKYAGMSMEQVYDLLPQEPEDEDEDGQGNNGCGEFEQPAEGTNANEIEADWKVATIQAATMASAQGTLPGSLRGLIKALKETRVDWRSATLKFAQTLSNSDYTWTQPNRRYVQSGLYLPSLRSVKMGDMVVVIDTSGSTQSVLPMFGAHLQTILDTVRPRMLYVVYCDDDIQPPVDTYEPDDELMLRKDGGGGTSFIPPFTWIEDNQIEPACMIYLTDLDGPCPQHAPSYPVLWACTDRDNVGPFGETVFIGDV